MTVRNFAPHQLASLAACTLALAGCTVGPDFVKPDSGLGRAKLASSGEYGAVAATSDADVPPEWWTIFQDATLAKLQSTARDGNLDLQIAAERIQQARAQLGIVASALLPTVDATGTYQRQALSPHGQLAALHAPTRPGDFWQLGLDASWEIDLWGH